MNVSVTIPAELGAPATADTVPRSNRICEEGIEEATNPTETWWPNGLFALACAIFFSADVHRFLLSVSDVWSPMRRCRSDVCMACVCAR